MKISESMRRAGWRECPDQETWDRWRDFGYWQMVDVSERIVSEHYDYTLLKRLRHLPKYCRPINKCGDFDIRGWGEQPAPVVPDKPDDNGGAWWYRCNNGSTLLCYISSAIVSIIESRDIPSYEGDRIELSRMQQTYRGQWLGPCVKPEVSDGKP